MRCKHCGAANPDWNPHQSPDMLRFCVQCGAELEPPSVDAQDSADAASSAAQAASAAVAASAAASGARRARSAPNSKFGGDLAPAATLGGVGKTASAPTHKPASGPVSADSKFDWATHETPGAAPSPAKKSEPIYEPKPSPPKKSGATGWIIGVLIVIGLAVFGYFNIHSWKPATCTDPETCSICGKTRGEALGHTWMNATCTEPKTCTVCGETEGEANGHRWIDATCTSSKYCSVCNLHEGSPLGHDWIPATYDTPETCSRCGTTRGDVKGYIDLSNISQTWGDYQVEIDGWNVSFRKLSSAIRNCNRLQIGYGYLMDPDSSYYGNWKVYVWTTDNTWRFIGTIRVDASAFHPGGTSSDLNIYTLEISPAVSFSAITIVPAASSGSFKANYLWVESAQSYS